MSPHRRYLGSLAFRIQRYDLSHSLRSSQLKTSGNRKSDDFHRSRRFPRCSIPLICWTARQQYRIALLGLVTDDQTIMEPVPTNVGRISRDRQMQTVFASPAYQRYPPLVALFFKLSFPRSASGITNGIRGLAADKWQIRTRTRFSSMISIPP